MRTARLVNRALCALPLLLVLVAPPGAARRAFACADLIDLFVTRGAYDRAFGERMLELSVHLRTLEVNLHAGRTAEVQADLDGLIERWMTLYTRYAAAPPTGWVGRDGWLPGLAEVSRAMTALSVAARSEGHETVHARVRAMNEALVALLRDGAPNSDATLLELAGRTADLLRAGMLAGSSPVDLARGAADLRTLAAQFRDATPAAVPADAAAEYAAARDGFVHAADALPEAWGDPAADESALAAAERALAAFRALRARLLKQAWF